MQPIGLIAAMTLESEALLHCVDGAGRIPLGHFPGHIFEISG